MRFSTRPPARAIIPSQPVDAFFFDRYKQKYGLPELTNRVTMPIDVYADKLAGGPNGQPTR